MPKTDRKRQASAKVSGDCVLLDWIMWMERGGFIISYQNPIKITRAHRK